MSIIKQKKQNVFPLDCCGLIVILFGLLILSSCAATTNTLSSPLSQAMETTSSNYTMDASALIAMENSASDEDPVQDEYIEEDPFDEDPFEEDPFDNSSGTQKSIVEIADPLSGWNRIIFNVNDRLYYWVMKPVANGYRVVMPTPFRIGIKNFFTNLLGPLRFVNCVLQGKGEAADAELVRFVMNSTVGVLGFGNPAQNYPELAINNEDFGQTFGKWGIGHGFYIVWPILGPSSLRDSFGILGDYALKPVSYVSPYEAGIGIWAVDNINDYSFRLGDYEALKDAALDPYEAFRNAYIQYRRNQVAK